MLSRKPLKMWALKLVYNTTQIVVCGMTFCQLLPYFALAKHGYGIGLAPAAHIELWVFCYFCCKILDFGDTAFMVLEKKDRQLTFLHMWHHGSIVPLFAYYLSTGMGAGMVATLPLWNSLVHVLMYGHYLFMSLYPTAKAWWKPLITASQMGHHMLCMVYMVLNYYGGHVTPGIFTAGMIWGASILLLFANFYVMQYMQSSSAARLLTNGPRLFLVLLVAVSSYVVANTDSITFQSLLELPTTWLRQ